MLAARWLLHDNKEWFTNIGLDFGFDFKYNNANSHKLLRLMESRKTTRREDMAYCLIGIFQLDFPIMYGEGYRAQERLLEALCQQYGDLSWLYWRGESSTRKGRYLLPGEYGTYTYDCFTTPTDFNQMNNNCIINHLGLELTCRFLSDTDIHEIILHFIYILFNENKHIGKYQKSINKAIEMIESQSDRDRLAVCFIPGIHGALLVEKTKDENKLNVFHHIITLHWPEIPATAKETRVTIG